MVVRVRLVVAMVSAAAASRAHQPTSTSLIFSSPPARSSTSALPHAHNVTTPSSAARVRTRGSGRARRSRRSRARPSSDVPRVHARTRSAARPAAPPSAGRPPGARVDARISQPLGDGRHHALGQRQLVHAGNLGRRAELSMGRLTCRGDALRQRRAASRRDLRAHHRHCTDRVARSWRRAGRRLSPGGAPPRHRAGARRLRAQRREGVWIEIEGAPQPSRASSRVCDRAAAARAHRRARDARAPDGEVADDTIASTSCRRRRRARARAAPGRRAPCADCLRELGDPRDRRYRYPFINCTACGPRFTIVRDVALRPRGDDHGAVPAVRRRAAASTKIRRPPLPRRGQRLPACGPTLAFVDGGRASRRAHQGEEALARRCGARRGGIVAVKGAGGFLLAVDARDERRSRAARPQAAAAQAARGDGARSRGARGDRDVSTAARAGAACRRRGRSCSLPRRADAPLPPSLRRGSRAGRLPAVDAAAAPAAARRPALLVMTSGNRPEEPIARDDDERSRACPASPTPSWSTIATIHTRADDSVVRVVGGEALPMRRARGFVPDAIALPLAAPPLRRRRRRSASATVCLARGGEAFLSPHLGDLDDADTFALFEETIAKLGRCSAASRRSSRAISTPTTDRRAGPRAGRRDGAPARRVQHHHAHVASCLVDHGRGEPRLGVVFDGTGCGHDGRRGAASCWSPTSRLRARRPPARPPLLGGEAAIRSPWRLAVAALLEADARRRRCAPASIARAHRRAPPRAVLRLCADGAAPLATGAGRWFDAVAALCGCATSISYDGQAAIELEAASPPSAHGPYPFAARRRSRRRRAVRHRSATDGPRDRRRRARGHRRPRIVSARFHDTLARDHRRRLPRARADERHRHRGADRRLLPEPAADRARPRGARAERVRGAAAPARAVQRRRHRARPGRRRASALRAAGGAAMCLGIPGEVIAVRERDGCRSARCASAASRARSASSASPTPARRLRAGPRRLRDREDRSRGGGARLAGARAARPDRRARAVHATADAPAERAMKYLDEYRDRDVAAGAARRDRARP